MDKSGQQNNSTASDFDTETLVTRITSGDRSAEQLLANRYWRGLTFVLNRQTDDKELVADLVQDTFIIVITKARNGAIDNPAALSAFIRQTGINLLIAHYRKEKRRATQPDDDIDIRVPTDALGMSHLLNSEKAVQLVQQVMQELNTKRDCQILQNYFIYEQDKKQICADLQLSAEHFDRVLFRARQRLKQLILHKLHDTQSNNISSSLLTITLLVSLQGYQQTTINLIFFHIQMRETATTAHLFNKQPWSGRPFESKSLTTELRPG
ncbi:RNA polymerase sigma factor [Neptunicella sp. SCSIO 80796]|uniref:RNA polymerase sigma factor n=1 Tax=Neptunicella plasticusilytica TaxID=3117012 RepID=UPI003A4DDD69